MKKLRWVAGIVAVILLLVAVAIGVLANPNRHRELIQAQIEKQLGRKVSLGEMSLGLLPLRFEVLSPVIAEDPRVRNEPPFVRAEKLDIRIGLLPLIMGNVRVDSLELQRPSVELVKTAQGVWNFSSIGSSSAPAGGTGSPDPAAEFSLGRLAILDGQIGITDLQQRNARTGYDHVDLALLDYSAGKPFSFDLAAHIQGEGEQELRLKGEAGPVSEENVADTPFRGTLNLNQVSIDGLMQFLDSTALPQVNGSLSGDSEITSQPGSVTSKGKLRVDGAKVNALDIGYPIVLDYQLSAGTPDSLVTIDNATLQLGSTPLSVTGSINTARTPADIDLRIKSGDVSVAEIARLASAFGVAFAPGTTVAGRVNADVRAKGPAAKPAVTGTIAGRDLHVSGAAIPQPVQIKAIDLALSPTAIQSNEFTATTGMTTVTSRFSLLQYTSNSPSIDLALRAPGATLPEIQSIVKAYGLTGLDQISGAGTLNFDLRARGPARALSAADALRALNGTINVDFSPLKIAGFDALYELGKLGGFGSGLSGQSATDIVRLLGKITIKDGIAQTDDLRAQFAPGNLAAAGSGDLATETLNLKLSMIFSKEFSDRVKGSRAGGFVNTAFANTAGELVLPAIVTGTFMHPKFAPDLKAVADLQRQKFLPGKNRAEILSNVLGTLTGGKNESQTEEQPAEKKPSGLKGLLDTLGGRK